MKDVSLIDPKLHPAPQEYYTVQVLCWHETTVIGWGFMHDLIDDKWGAADAIIDAFGEYLTDDAREHGYDAMVSRDTVRVHHFQSDVTPRDVTDDVLDLVSVIVNRGWEYARAAA